VLVPRFIEQQGKEKSVHHLPIVDQYEKSKKPKMSGPGFFSRMLGHGQRAQVY
jgi:hypothetical protein